MIPRFIRTLLRNDTFCEGISSHVKYLLSPVIPEYRIKVRGIRKPLYVRGRTTDPIVLRTTFFRATDYSYLIPENGVVFDLGCNVGYTMAALKEKRPDVKIIGVEMDKGNALQAEKNTGLPIFTAAIWDKDGCVDYSGKDQQSFCAVDGTKTPAISFRSLIRFFGIEYVDFVKMDIEGAESRLFVKPTWLKYIGAMHVEIHNGDLEEIAHVLKEEGFFVERDPKHWSAIVAYRP